jgi:hypothetical protein
MNTAKIAPRLLGAAFLLVIFTSLTSGLLLQSAVGSGDTSTILVSISKHIPLIRLSVLFEMLNSSCIIILAVLLYTILNKQNKILAGIALGWWLGEALILGLTSMGALALIPLSLDFVKGGLQQNSFYITLGEFLYHGVNRYGYSGVHMWFYCIGGMIWYSLFYRSRYIPRPISFFGILAASLAFIAVVMNYLGYGAPIWMSIPLLPFELSIGFWLLLRGIKEDSVVVSKAQTLPAGGNS